LKKNISTSTSTYSSITLKVCSGRDLASKDANGKSDPYCNIWCGAQKFKTKVKPKTLAPVWDETFTIPFPKTCQAKVSFIEIECWDVNVLLKDEFMGEFKFQIDTIPIGKPHKEWYRLTSNAKDKKKKGVVSGEICLEITKS